MNYDKFTVKAQAIVQDATSLVHEYNHSGLEPEHLALAMVRQTDGVVPPLLNRLGVSPHEIETGIETILKGKPQVYGDSQQMHLSKASGRVLTQAEKEAGELKDDYTSTEHILLAMLMEDTELGRFLKGQRPHQRRGTEGASVHPGKPARDRSESREPLPGARQVLPRPHRSRPPRQARPGHRP